MSASIKILTVIFWSLVVILSGYFLYYNVLAYFYGYRSELFGDTLFQNQLWFIIHMSGGTLLLILGPLQFWNWFRIKYIRVHRLLGMIYLVGAGFTGFSALGISLISQCVPCRVSLFLLAAFLLLSSALAWITIKRHNIKAHRQFMIRSYLCALAFVTVRIDGIFPLDFLFGYIDEPIFRRTVNEYFFSFVPLIIAEIIMTWLPAVTNRQISLKQS
jgi:uncharacterized membrane protein